MRPLPPVAAAQHDVFTVPQALNTGWTISALRHAADRGDLDRLCPGVYAVPLGDVGDRHEFAAAELRRAAVAVGLTHRRSTVSHRAAAALHSLPVVHATTTPCVTFARPFRGRIRGAHLHRAFLWPGDVVRRDAPVLFTSPARTVVDLARELGADDGVVAAESALESISRLRMIDARLPAPSPQATIRAGGVFLGRVDFYRDEYGVVGETDGMSKYDTRSSTMRAEKRRQGPMEDAGLIFVRWGWDDLRRFDRVADRLQAAFARGLRPRPRPAIVDGQAHLSLRSCRRLISVTS